MTPDILVIGTGFLADSVCQLLADSCKIIRHETVPPPSEASGALALVLHDAWHPAEHLQAEASFSQSGIPWLRGFVACGEGIIGPLVQPGQPGCSACADSRQIMAGSDRIGTWRLKDFLTRDAGISRDPYATDSGLSHMACVTAAEVRRSLQGQPPHLAGRIFRTELKTLQSSRHSFLPDPLCPVCGRLPDDSPEAAQIKPEPRPKLAADKYRTRSVEDIREQLLRDCLDPRTGLTNGYRQHFGLPFAVSSVTLPLLTGNEVSSGRTLSFADSRLTALLEALERYGGYEPRGKRTVVRDSYRYLQDIALNPASVGLHDPKHYAKKDFPFAPFHPDRPMNWVWGYSLLQKRPLLVPERLAYYSLGDSEEDFVYETSNGSALGGSVEEAILYGMLEVVERDAFLMTWYAQLPLPRLDLFSIPDPEVQVMAGYLRHVTGYDLHLFNSTMENGIPSLIALAKNRKSEGVNLLCASSSHLDPLQAVKSAVLEVASLIRGLDSTYEEHRERCLRMLRNPSLVRNMDDHVLLYSLPEAEERFGFLLDERRDPQTFEQAFAPPAKRADLTEDLQHLLGVFRSLNLDVIAVDQTTPEMKRLGLHAVKVLIPGMLPMTFGQHLIRLEGLERVLQVPKLLGYVDQPLTRKQLNRHPHPFP